MTDTIAVIVGRLNAIADQIATAGINGFGNQIKAEADRLAALGDLEKDAARYRWMRRGLACPSLLPPGVADAFADALDQNDATKFDQCIDTAMQPKEPDDE